MRRAPYDHVIADFGEATPFGALRKPGWSMRYPPLRGVVDHQWKLAAPIWTRTSAKRSDAPIREFRYVCGLFYA
jgi:hypothetical protein